MNWLLIPAAYALPSEYLTTLHSGSLAAARTPSLAPKSSALSPAAQAVRPAKHEGAGDVYLHANIRKLNVLLWRAHFINDTEFARRIALKAGHTNCMACRQSQYAKCKRGGRIIVWLGRYRVRHCCFVERLLHLRVFQSGGYRFRFCCACRVNHQEYVSLRSTGGFTTFCLRAAAALAFAGEGLHYRRFPCLAAVLSQCMTS
ncbi:hypothetical protein DFH06DRAFT_1350231 [Mycena polygramma]|nr:hypothetical protein DFH06DRAFT_1350231 [Mycena polygramma]